MAKNRVFINDEGIVEITVAGDQTIESIRKAGNDAAKLGRQSWTDGRPSLILDDLFQIGKVPHTALRYFISLSKELNYDKLALVGDRKKLGSTNLVLRAIGMYAKVRFFDDRKKAIEWLKTE